MSNNGSDGFSVYLEDYRRVGMNEKSVLLSPCALGATTSLFGLGGGYVLAPRKYTLDRLLMQSDDSFNRHFSSDIMENATDAEKKALSNLKNAAVEYRNSGSKIYDEKIKPNAKLWHDMVQKVNVEDKFVSEADMAKKSYLDALKQSSFYKLKTKLELAKDAVRENPKNAALNFEMKAAARDFAEAQLAVSTPAKQYKNARSSLRAAREKAIQNLPDNGRAIAVQWDKVRRALSDRANVMYEKLATLSKNDNLNRDYIKIKKYLPKARTYSALMGGLLAGIFGTIAGVYHVNKIQNS